MEISQDVDGVFKSLGAVTLASCEDDTNCWSWHYIAVTPIVRESCYRFQVHCSAVAGFAQLGSACDLVSLSALTHAPDS